MPEVITRMGAWSVSWELCEDMVVRIGSREITSSSSDSPLWESDTWSAGLTWPRWWDNTQFPQSRDMKLNTSYTIWITNLGWPKYFWYFWTQIPRTWREITLKILHTLKSGWILNRVAYWSKLSDNTSSPGLASYWPAVTWPGLWLVAVTRPRQQTADTISCQLSRDGPGPGELATVNPLFVPSQIGSLPV